METLTKGIVEQLVDMYIGYSYWDNGKPSYEETLKYFQERWDKGVITCYVENDEVLGFYERYISGDTCYLKNVIVLPKLRLSKVFLALYKNFFLTLPDNINKVIGDKQKINGKHLERVITKQRRVTWAEE